MTLANFTLPNGDTVQFEEQSHSYTVNGKSVPSITQIVSEYYGNAYAQVSPEKLKQSARYGTKVHEELSNLIEARLNGAEQILAPQTQEAVNYFKLVEPIYNIKPIKTEQVVVLYDENKNPVAAGRFDLLCDIDGDAYLVDFKTTSVIHRKEVTAQLNLYALAAYQSGYVPNDDLRLGVVHLSGSTSKFIPIPRLGQSFYFNFTF